MAAFTAFTIKTEIPASRVSCLLITAFEGGVGYWAAIDLPISCERTTTRQRVTSLYNAASLAKSSTDNQTHPPRKGA